MICHVCEDVADRCLKIPDEVFTQKAVVLGFSLSLDNASILEPHA
jgi:hypothetical protein